MRQRRTIMINSLGVQIATGYLFQKTIKTIRGNATYSKENKSNKYDSKAEEDRKETKDGKNEEKIIGE